MQVFCQLTLQGLRLGVQDFESVGFDGSTNNRFRVQRHLFEQSRFPFCPFRFKPRLFSKRGWKGNCARDELFRICGAVLLETKTGFGEEGLQDWTSWIWSVSVKSTSRPQMYHDCSNFQPTNFKVTSCTKSEPFSKLPALKPFPHFFSDVFEPKYIQTLSNLCNVLAVVMKSVSDAHGRELKLGHHWRSSNLKPLHI